jgi:hypothetical protein
MTFTASTENSDAHLFTKSAQQRMLFASRIIEPEERQRALDAITSDPCSNAVYDTSATDPYSLTSGNAAMQCVAFVTADLSTYTALLRKTVN